jgi:hypothetical protein
VEIRIEGVNFPPGHRDIQVGVQRRNRPSDVVDWFDGRAATAEWTFDCTVQGAGSPPDITGPYVQGGPGGRFIYLTWAAPTSTGWSMFRRAKLMLADVPEDLLTEAAEEGLLVGRLELTDANGEPVCARVRPPAISWSAA